MPVTAGGHSTLLFKLQAWQGLDCYILSMRGVRDVHQQLGR